MYNYAVLYLHVYNASFQIRQNEIVIVRYFIFKSIHPSKQRNQQTKSITFIMCISKK